MPDHTHLKYPTNICCFHGPLVTSKYSTSYLNLFLRYSCLKNPAFYLALRFLDHKSRTTFFSNMLFLQKIKRLLTLSYWRKKCISEWIGFFAKALKGSYLGLFDASESIWTFFQKLRSATFLIFWCLTLWKNNWKNLWSRDLAFQTDGKTKKVKFLRYFC